MRFRHTFALTAFAPILIVILGACSQEAAQRTALFSLPPAVGSAAKPPVEPTKKVKVLYAGYEGGVCIFKNGSWKEQGCFSGGMNDPSGVSADRKGDLYVANLNGADVTEYAGGSRSPDFTYHGDISFPIDVVVDRHANIFEIGPVASAEIGVDEFHHRVDQVVASCTMSSDGVTGIAIDKHGDVFFGTYNSSQWVLFEYKGGLQGCSATQLATLALPGQGRGMAFDKNDNLLVCNQDPQEIDVFKPPYSGVSGTFGSGLVPFDVSLNKKNNVAYVTGVTGLDVLSYPSGSLIAHIPSYGFSSVVDGINYAP